MDSPIVDRRDFSVGAVMALLGGVTVTVSGCSGSDGSASPTAPPRTPGAGDVVGSISQNHGHSAIVTAAQLGAGNAVTLNIRGSGDHDHLVSLSADELARIAASQQVVSRSSNDDSHFHEITFG